MRYHPPSIKLEGLRKYLNRTAVTHNGQNYDNFVEYLRVKVPKIKIASLFKVNRQTIDKWVDIHNHEERKVAKKASDEAALDELSDV